MRFYHFLLFIFPLCLHAQSEVVSPEQFLTSYGRQFSYGSEIEAYFKYVADRSGWVRIVPYGQTIEGRPLYVAVVSSKENLLRLGQLRKNNLRMAGLEQGRAEVNGAKPVVWFNCGVHGNEPGPTEASMELLYLLATQKQDWLKDVIVIINPVANPDGRARYVNWNRSVSNQVPMPMSRSREHREAWPSGRVNHYYFDLNRDWAWASQPETRALLKAYHQWMPQIFVDLHEQHPNGGSFFAPPAEPVHSYVTDFQRAMLGRLGKEIALSYDEKGWRYFTGEVFDLFYPGYGDTYPVFNGAIAMTFEQPGHAVAGRALLLDTGDTLTIFDRIEHAVTMSMTVARFAARHRSEIIKGFANYFKNPPSGAYKTFVVKNTNGYQMNRLLHLLDLHHIQYGTIRQKIEKTAFSYQTLKDEPVTIENGDLVISTDQPMSVLAQVLLEPQPELKYTKTYDITAWALPYAMGLKAYALKSVPPRLISFDFKSPEGGIRGHGKYAWLVEWKDIAAASLLSELLQAGVRVRFANKNAVYQGKKFERGTLMVMAADNKDRSAGNLEELLERLSAKHKVPVFAMESGFSEEGIEMGSQSFKLIDRPKVAVFYTEASRPYNYGEIWHFLDAKLKMPFTSITADDFPEDDIWDFNILIFPSGQYGKMTKKELKYVEKWVALGGKLILFGKACELFRSSADLSLKQSQEQKEGEETEEFRSYLERVERVGRVPGGIVKLTLDTGHPLAYGYPDYYFSLKTREASYDIPEAGFAVGRIPSEVETVGFFEKSYLLRLSNDIVIGARHFNRGRIYYFVDDPLFRDFWHAGELFVANAVFFR